jgi:FxsC-like protein
MKIFVSYARNDLDGGELEAFLVELERDLKARTGDKAEMLFRDLKDLRLGDQWKPALESALKTSRLLLAICSSSFCNSEYCGKEFAVFLDRLDKASQAHVGSNFRAIFPIVWLPPSGGMPQNIKRFQFAHAQLPKTYTDDGLRPLFRLARNRDDALDFVSVLARQMADALAVPLPEAETLTPLDRMPNAFASGGAAAAQNNQPAVSKKTNCVTIIVAAGQKLELEQVRAILASYDDDCRMWRPFIPESDRSIWAEAATVAGSENLGSEVLPVDDQLIKRIEKAEENNEIVLLLVDPWTLLLPHYADRIKPFDKRYSANCAMIAIWNGNDEETKRRSEDLEKVLGDVFPHKIHFVPSGHVFTGVQSRSELLFHLKQAITEAKLRIIQVTSRHRRAEQPLLQRQAAEAGIDVTAPALLRNTSGYPR